MHKKEGQLLVVEDEAVTALDIVDILERVGYSVVGHEVSGEAALEKLEQVQPQLIIMDINLKGELDGISTAGKVWDKYKIPVVFLTAFGDEATLGRAKLVDPYGYVLKPFEDDDLLAAVDLALYRAQKGHKEKERHKEHEVTQEMSFGDKTLSPYEFLRRVDPFRQLDDDALEDLASACSFRSLSDNEQLLYEGDEFSEGFIVASGRIVLVKNSSSGKELAVDVLPPGDIFATVLASQDEPCAYTARASVASKVLFVPKATLQLLLESQPFLYKEFTSYMTERVKRSHDFARQLAHEKVEVRIAGAITSLLTDFAKHTEGFYVIEMTRQQLADLTGTTPETAIRTTKKMERDGILNLETPGSIKVVDVDRLDSLAAKLEE